MWAKTEYVAIPQAGASFCYQKSEICSAISFVMHLYSYSLNFKNFTPDASYGLAEDECSPPDTRCTGRFRTSRVVL